MIPLSIRLLAIGSSLAYLTAVVMSLRRSRMTIRQSVLWLGSGVMFLGISLFPQPLLWTAGKLGFVAPSNAAFAMWLLFLTVLLFYQSLVTSIQSRQIKMLCQELALLEQGLMREGVVHPHGTCQCGGEIAPNRQAGHAAKPIPVESAHC